MARGDLKGSPAQALFAATLGFFTGFAAVALFGPTATRFQELMQLGPVAVGLLVAMPALSGSLLRIPFAAWVDIKGGRVPFLVLLGLSIVGMTGLFLVVHFLYPSRIGPELFPVLLILGVLAGCGIATFSVGISQVSYWFPQARQGTALGTYGGIGNIAPGLFSFLIPVALREWGLAGSYLAWLIFLVAGTACYALWGRNAPFFQWLERGLNRTDARANAARAGQELFPALSVKESLRLSAGTWKTWALVLVYFTTFGGFIGLTAWLPTYWQKFMETGVVTAGALTALYSISASLVRVAGGYVSDRIGGHSTAIVGLSTSLLGAVLLVFSNQLGLSVAGVVSLALGMGVTNAAVFKLVPQAVPTAVGGAAGWVGGIGALGGFVIPPLMAAFVALWGPPGFSLGFGLFIGLGLVALGAVLLLRRSAGAARVVVGRAARPEARERISVWKSPVATVVLAIAVFFSFAALASKVNGFRLPGNQQGYAPVQPIAYSHRLHAGELGIACVYCHSGATRSRHAGIPSAGVCMNCHRFVTATLGAVQAEDEAAKAEKRAPQLVRSGELQKLYKAMALDSSMKPDSSATAQPIEWTRVHKLPDFVYFDHRAHVNAGVECQKCHGPVETMERMRQVETLSMGWCVNCHRQGIEQTGRKVTASIDCQTCHF